MSSSILRTVMALTREILHRVLTIDSSEREGAILFLPEGASREDLIALDRIHAYASEHATDWYQYFSRYTNKGLPNGSVYIVTGTDKCKSWSMASFPLSFEQHDGVSARLTDGRWLGSNVHRKESRRRVEDIPYPNECIFLRGIRMCIGGLSWIEHFDEDDFELRYQEVLAPPPPLLQRWLTKAKSYLPHKTSGENEDSSNESSDSSPEYQTVRFISTSFFITELNFSQLPFHPSDIIAQTMLSQVS